MAALDREDLENRFGHKPPKDEATARAHNNVRNLCLSLAESLKLYVPPGRELSLAITNLEQVMMWANAGIARENGRSNNVP